MSGKTLILYHDDLDGCASAFLIGRNTITQERQCIPVQYGEEPPLDLIEAADTTFIVDFSYPPEKLESVRHKNVILIDHHKGPCALWTDEKQLEYNNWKIITDTSMSGTMLCWHYVRRNHEWCLKNLNQYFFEVINAHDLWKFENDAQRDTAKFLTSVVRIPEDVGIAHDIVEQLNGDLICNDDSPFGGLFNDAAEANTRKNLEKADVGNVVLYNGYDNNLQELNPDKLCIGWRVMGGKVVFSVRGNGAYELATSYPGGGGHARAAGFSLPFKEGMALVQRYYETNHS